MANEPDNLILVHLREIRATLAERFAHSDERFAQMDKRFDEIDKRFEDFHALTSHTLMLSTSNSLRSQDLILSGDTSSARGSTGAYDSAWTS